MVLATIRPGRSRVGDLGKKTAGAAPLHKRNVTALKTCKVGPGASVVLAAFKESKEVAAVSDQLDDASYVTGGTKLDHGKAKSVLN